MITVKMCQNSLEVSGHARTAPSGQDIVCAAVSAITLTLIMGLEEVAQMDIQENVDSGNIKLEWQRLNDTGKALIDTWYLGMCGIAREHENCIRFV